MKEIKLNNLNYQHELGFTLIELVAVIILISILSVAVLPKFFSSNGFEENTYRDELITKLRAIQLRSMQQTTDGETCLQVQLETAPFSIGLQATDNDAATPICGAGYEGDTTTVTTIDSKHSINFTISEGLTNFRFSSLGQPEGCTAVVPCEITITITGEESLGIEINREGYIHAI